MIANLDPADLHVGKKIGCSIHNDSHSTKKLRPIIGLNFLIFIVELSRFKGLTPYPSRKEVLNHNPYRHGDTYHFVIFKDPLPLPTPHCLVSNVIKLVGFFLLISLLDSYTCS